jgi:DNA-directed RNA polymerase subunit N (RpoN/RPB10)
MRGDNKRRRYSHNRLISWTIGRCKLCGRFIGDRFKKYCKDCQIKHRNNNSIEWNRNHKELRRVKYDIGRKR